jgi:rhodanese-related sulfurtransferase
MLEVDIPTFAAALEDDATVIDVREPFEYAGGHVPGAQLIPLGQLTGRVGELPTDQPVYVICASGSRSLAAAGFLRRHGVDAHSVAGGTGAWRRAGRRVVQQSHAA